MNDEGKTNLNKQLKQYVRPQIEIVHMMTQETMGSYCKTTSSHASDNYTTCQKVACIIFIP